MLRDVLGHETTSRGTRLGAAARFLSHMLRRRALMFWISDFEDRLDPRDWRVLSRRHEVTALALRDPRDEMLPAVGWATLEDLETGERRLVDTGSERVRRAYQARARESRRELDRALSAAQCPVLELRTDRPVLPVLMRYFGRAAHRRRGVA